MAFVSFQMESEKPHQEYKVVPGNNVSAVDLILEVDVDSIQIPCLDIIKLL